eukprot:jgi/Ulvmu1/3927/UM018_0150.1
MVVCAYCGCIWRRVDVATSMEAGADQCKAHIAHDQPRKAEACKTLNKYRKISNIRSAPTPRHLLRRPGMAKQMPRRWQLSAATNYDSVSTSMPTMGDPSAAPG